MYLAASKMVVSVVLLRINSKGKQLQVYYVSKTMVPAELRFSLMEKVALAFAQKRKSCGHISKPMRLMF